jgi:DNA-binding transcriptional LysR family regulator
VRICSRPGCGQVAVYTLTYVYRDSTAVLGPLAAYVEPHCYDLCSGHAGRLTAPRGWEVVRLPIAEPDPVPTDADDLEALANAVREGLGAATASEPVGQGVEVGRRGHLRVLRSAPATPPGPDSG